MSAAFGVRRRGRRVLALGALLALALALTATLASAIQVRGVRVAGTRRFPAAHVERVLEVALGSPTVIARPEQLRDAVLGVPWVADATVRVTLDGVVACAVEERQAVAVGVDGGHRTLIDATGRQIGEALEGDRLLELRGFAPHPQERPGVLAAAASLAAGWGAPLVTVERLGPRDLALTFSDTACTVVADPACPQTLAVARRVLAAWQRQVGIEPRRIDVRIPARVALLPAVAEDPAAPLAATARSEGTR